MSEQGKRRGTVYGRARPHPQDESDGPVGGSPAHPVSAPPGDPGSSAPPVSGPPGTPVSGMPGYQVSGPPAPAASMAARPASTPAARASASVTRAGAHRPAPRATVYGAGAASTRPEGGLPAEAPDVLVRPRVGGHTATSGTFARLLVPHGPAGLVLGRDQGGAPVTVRLFQDQAVRVAMVGGLWLARVLVFRSLALGARVVVHTQRPTDWQGLGRWAVGRDDRVSVLTDPQHVTVPASPTAPVLTVYDLGTQGPPTSPLLGPWRAQLTVLSQLNAFGFTPVEEAHVFLAQRLTAAEAYAAQSVRQFGDDTVYRLQQLNEDMLAMIGGGSDTYLWTLPTRMELDTFGKAGR